ncbi:1,2-dihydroxy-3-keto-5-methylthiopentene dioxygenase [Leptospira sp. GIMC2001]|uniref:1,2-dihydroxy-3-keto-5-methylthiopentene dioxygenase n=1 Tax=Leptospira sp. GIMC2001 TaxID=1513297 RepID=UPI0023496417|nr:cupin domain-containing protein [Leptospira sp. GIMC2001]WCL48187.1 cupin domain-containing protein [Leptospira sp. GIMC2001]
MATITLLSNKTKISNPSEVKDFLGKQGIEYRLWETSSDINNLLNQESLSDQEKEEVLLKLDNRFQELSKEFGYKARDLIVLNPNVPGIQDMLAKFDKLHYHTDDEVRYIVDGSGIFGFLINGQKFTVEVEKNDFISVPKNTNHWFELDSKLRIKAVRYFLDNSGWAPVYVNEKDLISSN